MAAPEDIIRFMEDNHIMFVDLRYTDPLGKFLHLTEHVNVMTAEAFEHGVVFDGSLVPGWQDLNVSDLILRPDPDTAIVDPFYAEATLTMFCDVQDPEGDKPYAKCPRLTALRAENYMASTGIADGAYFGPEIEFFLFDEARYSTDAYNSFFQLRSFENPRNESADFNASSRIDAGRKSQGKTLLANPIDMAQDIRTEMMAMMLQLGIDIEKHHHEVASAQQEMGIQYAPLLRCADCTQIFKYVVHNVAHAYGKTASFMPRPVQGENGSGMCTHQSLWREGKPLFAGDAYDGLSKEALYYIGGVFKHARTLNALTNPTTNSYKRLVPGYDAPSHLAFGKRNRSAACRIPHASHPSGKRIEVRFPDPSANPYLAFSAMLMAGLDGIKNKIDPGKPEERNLFDLPEAELGKFNPLCASLEEAIKALSEDKAFLLEGGVFTEEMIASFIELKQEECERLRLTPHPAEFEMYYES